MIFCGVESVMLNKSGLQKLVHTCGQEAVDKRKKRLQHKLGQWLRSRLNHYAENIDAFLEAQ